MGRPKKVSTSSDLDSIDIDSFLAHIDKKYGGGSVFKLGSDEYTGADKGVISTGILSLDQALGANGFPRGRIIELYGPTGGGKTTLAIKAAAEAQKAGDTVFFIDAEYALDAELAKNTGLIEGTTCVISQPDYGEQAFGIIDEILKQRIKSYIVLDSIAALIPKSELDGDFTDAVQPGVQARLVSRAIRKLTGMINQSNSVLVCINQVRSTIGGMIGASTTTPGGHALKFGASVRIKIQNVKRFQSNSEYIGHDARIRIEKNKVAIPFKETTVKLIYGSGLSSTHDIMNYAVAQNIISKSGNSYTYGDEKLGVGELNALKTLFSCQSMYKEIRNKVCANLNVSILRDDMYCDKSLALVNKTNLNEIQSEDSYDLNPFLGEPNGV